MPRILLFRYIAPCSDLTPDQPEAVRALVPPRRQPSVQRGGEQLSQGVRLANALETRSRGAADVGGNRRRVSRSDLLVRPRWPRRWRLLRIHGGTRGIDALRAV